jgi:cysteine desulfurase
MKSTIYLDNAATTMPDPEVFKAMLPFLKEESGNASALHKKGVLAAKGIEKARCIIAKSINAEAEEIIFTSGGTEANNFALKGIAFYKPNKGKHIITSVIEHSSVHRTCKWLETQGFEITYIEVDREGFVKPRDLEKAIRHDTILVSVMHVNNEIGTIEPIEAIGKICRDNKIYFHTDACQSFMKVPLDVKQQYLDLVTVNAHKIHGPQGVGALFVKKGVKIEPLLHGGGQEMNLRSGTYNVAGIVGFGKAVEISSPEDITYMSELRDYIITGMENNIPDLILNGSRNNRVCNNINFSFKSVPGKTLLLELDKQGITVSSGSACSSRSLKPSKVLLAIGLNPEEAHSAVRFSISKWTTREEINTALQVLIIIVNNLRNRTEIKL